MLIAKFIIFEEIFLDMKYQACLLILFSFFHGILFSQSCLPEGIHFTRQSQVDSFHIYFPGCTKIEGNVKISGNDISNLSGLNMLDSIFGYLDINYTYDLQDLVGLGNLKYIGGNFAIEDAHSLHYLTGLDSLTTVNGDLEIAWNDYLFSLNGLQHLTAVGGNVVINENWELTSLEGLDNLTSIGGSLLIGDWWSGNPTLTSLDGLNSLTSVGDGLFIGFNYDLTSLSGLSNLNSIPGELGIISNATLTSLSGLENVNASGLTRLWIQDNPVLTECHIQGICEYLADIHDMISIYNNGPGCDNPHEIADSCGFDISCLPYGNYYFVSQANVDSFPAYYPDCNSLEGYTYIEGDDINNLDSLYGIDTIGGPLFICGNPLLSSLNGLNNLRTIHGSFNLGYWEHGSNPLLTDMSGLEKLNYVGGEMLILGNGSLQNFNGLDSLYEIGLWFDIIQNPSLKSFEGVNNLHSVGEIGISGNDSLSSLNGLQGLVDITYTFAVQNNPVLTSLDGIENINTDSMMFLRIMDNDSLSECSVKSVCDFLGIPEANIIIEDNATGCNTHEEVEAACNVGVEEPAVGNRKSEVVCYPNPAFDRVTFDIRLQSKSEINLSVFNSMGQLVAIIQDGELIKGDHQLIWNAGGFPAGIYFYRFCRNTCSSTGKLVKLKTD